MKTKLLTLALMVLFATSGFTQEEGKPSDSPAANSMQPQVAVDRASLTLEFIKIENQSLFREIFTMIEKIYGRRIVVQNSGSNKTTSTRNLQMFNSSIAIYDNPDMTKRIKKVIARLDIQEEPKSIPSPELIVAEYQPRFISIDDARSALSPFARNIYNASVGRNRSVAGGSQSTRNVTTLNGRGIILIRDRAELVTKMLNVLKKVDQPKAQFLISCMLIQGDKTSIDERLVEILPKELRSMSPHKSFKMISSGVIRVTAGSGRKVTLSMEGADAVKSWLSFTPTSFDPRTGALGLDRIKVEFEKTAHGKRARQSFETAASITKDDYVVIGAFGDNPVFAVLHLIQTK